MTHITCRLTAKNWDQLRNPTLGNRVWVTFTFALIHHCRSRLRGMHWGTLEQQRGAMKHVGGSGETFMQLRRQLLKVVSREIAFTVFFNWLLFIFLLSVNRCSDYNYDYTHLMAFFSRTTWVSLYQKGKTSLDLYEARGDGVLGCSAISWTICKQSCSRQITTPTPHHSVFTGRLLFLMPYQQFQSTKKSKITNSNLSTISETDRISLRILTACWIFPVRALCSVPGDVPPKSPFPLGDPTHT